MTFRPRLSRAFVRFLLSLLAIAVQGYHYGVDDAAIYIPAVERFAHPSLFPYGADFFLSHSRVSIFSKVVGAAVRWLHMPLAWAVLAFHVLGIYLLLLAGHWLATLCFTRARAQWAATVTLASVLTIPVAGSALPIMDPYLTARSLSTPLTVFALAAILAARPATAVVLLAITALLHPQMAAYGIALVVLLSLPRFAPTRVPAEEALAGSIGLLRPPSCRISSRAGAGALSRDALLPHLLLCLGMDMVRVGRRSAAARDSLRHHAHPLIGGHASGGAPLPRPAGAGRRLHRGVPSLQLQHLLR